MEPCQSFSSWNSEQVLRLTPSVHQACYLDNGRELQTGEYRYRLGTGCAFIGIISKSVDTRREALNTPSVYGWNGYNAVYLDGVLVPGYGGYQSDMLQIGDTISLIVDCEQRVICLTNLTTKSTHKLAVDVKKCPLPWLLKVRSY
ncbi:unnamed protein product [Rotaria sp. Silwood1]|nr:unnamed protein product [Rotaria sp. Silwood1]